MNNVLVLSYYFPPMGMGGVQRTAKFVKYLPEFGWKPTVITDTPKSYFAWDNVLLQELLDGGTDIRRTGGKLSDAESKRKSIGLKNETIIKIISKGAQTFLIPDTKRPWKGKALHLADSLIKEIKFDIIYATAPPYTDFVIGGALKDKYGIPLIIDYRDSWVDCPNNFYPTFFHKDLNIKLESKVLSKADLVITINEPIKELIQKRYDRYISSDKIHVISQGFDKEDFTHLVSKSKLTGKMRITYSGSFLYYYTPEYFLKGLAAAIKEKPEMGNDVEAYFVGTFPDKFLSLIDELELKNIVKLPGYVDHNECIKYLLSSDVLWMMINKTHISDIHSTGKLYEYFGAGKPILASVPEGTARNSLLKHGASFITDPDNVNDIKNKLMEIYDKFKSGTLPVPDENYIKNYDRKNLTSRLAELFNKIIK